MEVAQRESHNRVVELLLRSGSNGSTAIEDKSREGASRNLLSGSGGGLSQGRSYKVIIHESEQEGVYG